MDSKFHSVTQVAKELVNDSSELFAVLRPAALYSLLNTVVSIAVPSKILQFIWQSPLGVLLDDPMDIIDLGKDIRNGYKTIKSLITFPTKSIQEKVLWMFGFYLGLVRIFVLQVYTGEIDRLMSNSILDDDDDDYDEEDKGITRVSLSWHLGNLAGLLLGLVGIVSMIQKSLKHGRTSHFLLRMNMISYVIAFLTCFAEAKHGGSFFTYSSTFLLGLGSSLLFTELISSKWIPNLGQKDKGKAVKEGRVVGRVFGAILNLFISMSIANEFQFGLCAVGIFLTAFLLNSQQGGQSIQEPDVSVENSEDKKDIRSMIGKEIRQRILPLRKL